MPQISVLKGIFCHLQVIEPPFAGKCPRSRPNFRRESADLRHFSPFRDHQVVHAAVQGPGAARCGPFLPGCITMWGGGWGGRLPAAGVTLWRTTLGGLPLFDAARYGISWGCRLGGAPVAPRTLSYTNPRPPPLPLAAVRHALGECLGIPRPCARRGPAAAQLAARGGQQPAAGGRLGTPAVSPVSPLVGHPLAKWACSLITSGQPFGFRSPGSPQKQTGRAGRSPGEAGRRAAQGIRLGPGGSAPGAPRSQRAAGQGIGAAGGAGSAGRGGLAPPCGLPQGSSRRGGQARSRAPASLPFHSTSLPFPLYSAGLDPDQLRIYAG